MAHWGEAQKQAVRLRVSPVGAGITADALAEGRVGPVDVAVKRGPGG